MTLDKVIELLSLSANAGQTTFTQDFKDALKVAIAAVQWRLLMEKDYGSWCGPPLPGETEEGG